MKLSEVKLALRKRGYRLMNRCLKSRDIAHVSCLKCGRERKAALTSVLHKADRCHGCVSEEKKKTLDEVKEELKSTRIRILSKTYVKGKRHKYKCLDCGRIWLTQKLYGCRFCADLKKGLRNRLTQKEIKSRLHPDVETKSEYTGYFGKVRGQCRKCRHKWETTWMVALKGCGCPQCYGTKAKTISEIQKVVSKSNPNLILLSKKYHDLLTPIKLKCKRCDYTWTSCWNQIRHNPGKCPQCYPHKIGVSEDKARREIERLTGWEFPKVTTAQLPWLHGLHLDGYNQKHKVAFEYQGPQHYEHIDFGGKGIDPKVLQSQKRRDLRKRIQCWRHGVKLITIPYWTSDVAKLIRKRLNL